MGWGDREQVRRSNGTRSFMSDPARVSTHAVVGTAVTSAIIMGCGVITGLTAARSIGSSGRGELTAIIAWASTLLYAGTLGIPEAVTYFEFAVDQLVREGL